MVDSTTKIANTGCQTTPITSLKSRGRIQPAIVNKPEKLSAMQRVGLTSDGFPSEGLPGIF